MAKKEESLHIQVCTWLKLQYPDLIWVSDYAAGIRLSIGQAVKAKKMRSSKGLPDIMIFRVNKIYHGLFIELKTKTPYLKDGLTLQKNEHLERQNEMHKRLMIEGYRADFAVGFEQAKQMIDMYLSKEYAL